MDPAYSAYRVPEPPGVTGLRILLVILCALACVFTLAWALDRGPTPEQQAGDAHHQSLRVQMQQALDRKQAHAEVMTENFRLYPPGVVQPNFDMVVKLRKAYRATVNADLAVFRMMVRHLEEFPDCPQCAAEEDLEGTKRFAARELRRAELCARELPATDEILIPPPGKPDAR